MKWEIDQRRYTNGEVLFLGPWQVGGAHYDGTTTKTAKDKYRATCALPGIGGLGMYETRELAKQRVEEAVRSWLDKLPPNSQAKGPGGSLPGPLDELVGLDDWRMKCNTY